MGLHRCLVGPFFAQWSYKGDSPQSISLRRYSFLVWVYKRYVYIRQQEHRGHTVCLRFVIAD